MHPTRTLTVTTTSLALLLAVGASAAAQGDSPVQLRFAISDESGRPSEPHARAFIDEVAERSGGSVTLEPIWNAAGDDFERGVARQLVAGDADIGLVAGRAWDEVDVTSLLALQTPFLITDDAL